MLLDASLIGVDIFFREAQAVWPEFRPFADRRALHRARKLGLGRDADGLLGLVPDRDFVRLVAALVRVGLEDGGLEHGGARPSSGGR